MVYVKFERSYAKIFEDINLCLRGHIPSIYPIQNLVKDST